VYFGQLLTKSYEQEFCLGGVELKDWQSSKKRSAVEHFEGELCLSQSQVDERRRKVECQKNSRQDASFHAV